MCKTPCSFDHLNIRTLSVLDTGAPGHYILPTMSKPNMNPVFHLMGEMEFQDFVICAIDRSGEPVVIYRYGSTAGERAAQGFLEDWLEKKKAERTAGMWNNNASKG